MKQISLSWTAVNWKNSFIEAHVTTAGTCVHLLSLQRAHAQLHSPRVGFKHLLNETFLPNEKNWKYHDKRSFEKRKTNQEECPDYQTFLRSQSQVQG